MDSPKVIVLCGGRGSRLSPITDKIPKALVPVRGMPIIDHVVNHYTSNGYNEFIYCLGYKGDLVKEHLVAEYGSDHVFSDSGAEAGMLRRIFDAVHLGSGTRFIVAYCDTFIDYSPQRLIDQHTRLGTLATVISARVINPFGILSVDHKGVVDSFVEKPQQTYFIGTFMIDRHAIEGLDTKLISLPDGEGVVAMFKSLAEQRLLGSFQHNGLRISFNTEAERELAETELDKFYTLDQSMPPSTN